MSSIKDLSPKMRMKTASEELEIPTGTEQIGQRVGGISAFSNVFKRGYGTQIFGVDDNGIWLGAADFADAPIRLGMDGTFYIQNETGSLVINAEGITQYDENDIPVGFWGYREGLF